MKISKEIFTGHIHVHTEYSPLDGLASISELAKKASELGHTFMAVTDHGSSSGLFECAEIGEKYGIQIILGEEFYFENPEDLKLGHLILLAKDEVGLSNIFKLQKEAYGNFYYKPRINLEMLKKHHEGLICTTACIANQIGQYIIRNEDCLALNHIFELQQIFGEDLYIELQSSTVPEVIKVNKKLEEFCIGYNLQPIISNDVHYVNKEDYKIHEVLLCIQQKSKMDSPKRWKFEKNDYWLKNQEELEADLEYLKQETIENSYINLQTIANKCKKGLTLKTSNYLPKVFETKEEEDDELSSMVWKNYTTRLADRGECNEAFKNDLFKELKVISETGYSGYFLIVQEYANWARQNDILVGDGRGSGVGCKVAYTIGITEVNPQKHDLLFERFLSPGREPDFDIDFSDINAVYEHLQNTYGKDNVARVGAFSKFTAKSATRKVMGIYGYSQAQIAKIVALMPQRISFTLQEAIDESKELSSWFGNNKDIYKAVEKLEGIVEHLSTHAGGIIICNGLTEVVPVFTDSEDREKMIIALDKKQLEKLGHYKFDVLGLKSLILMGNTLKYIGGIDWHKINFEDENVYKMLCEGDVLGVFQLSDQKEKVMQQQPHCFEDLIAINALVRPGVCDWNTYLKCRKDNTSSDLEYMKCTHGLIVYQDQYLQLAQTYAGWDIAFSDKHIRKNKDILNDSELKEKFINDSLTNGYELEEILKLWGDITDVVSGGYGFNRGHSTSYAMLTYQTAYVKHYYPAEFYAAYMTQNVGDAVKINEVINLLKQKNIKIFPPDINVSTENFIPTQDGIQMSLTSIKGLGESAVEEIKRLSPINNFDDMLKRRVKKSLKSNNITALIKAGCFDKEDTRYNMLNKFAPQEKQLKDYEYEKDVFGFYLSASPFDKYDIKPFEDYENGEYVMTIIEPTEIVERYDRRGNLMAFITGVNNTDTIRMIAFSSVWNKTKCEEGQLALFKGKKDKGSFLVNSIETL